MSSTPTSDPQVAANSGGNSEVSRYLGAVFAGAPPGTFVELRARTRGGMRCIYEPVAKLADLDTTIAELALTTDVYVGVLPRARRGGSRDDVVQHGAVLWADCDTPESVAALHEFVPTPSITLASGSGSNRHAYWLLQQPVPISVVELANRRLATLLGADIRCSDAARVLRPPSLNYKHDPPTRVRLLDCGVSRRYDVADIIGTIDDVATPGPRPSNRSRALADGDSLLNIDPALYVEQLAGLSVSRHRKVACPFHDDRTPSLHVYREPSRGWFCFGCGRGGSIYDFAALLWGRPTRGPEFICLRDELFEVFGAHVLHRP